jgi:YidC/Oxa1 family membrane protein insertase
LQSLYLEIKNEGKDPQKVALKVLAYRPLKTADDHEKQFLGGSVVLSGKEHRFSAHEATKTFKGTPSRVMSQGRSYATILTADSPEGMFHVEHLQNGNAIGWIELPEKTVAPGRQIQYDFKLYTGPIAIGSLKEAGLEDAASFGAFSGITKILLQFLTWGHNRLNNYGLAICLLAVAVWLPFAPLTWYGMRASQQTMHKMALIKPQEARIRKEHSGNPTKTQQELMALYRKHGVNPASGCIGCLPFIFTMPIYIALFQVLNRAPELRGASFLFVKDLSSPDQLLPLPFALPLLGAHLNILPVVSTVFSFIQQKAMQPPQVGELTEEQKIQQQMFKFMPVMFLFLFYNLPSGFMIYWVINSMLTSAQQLLVRRSVK